MFRWTGRNRRGGVSFGKRLTGWRSAPPRQRRLRIESLEARWLLSGSSLLRITSMTPEPAAQLAAPPAEIMLTFNQAVGPDSLRLEHFHLEGSGGDGTFGDGNETVYPPTGLRFVDQTQVAVEWTGMTLPADRYRLRLGENPRHTFLEFDGIDDQVSTPLNIDQGPGSPGVTFEAWVNPSGPGDGRRHVISTDNGGWDWSILRENDQWHVFTGERSRSTGFAVEEGRWQHLAAVFEPDRGVTFFMDGQESFIPYIDYDASDNNVGIGRNPRYPEFFAGAIDEVRVWHGSRTAAEIRAGMHVPLAGTEPGLLGYWKFDEGQGQTVADSSPHGQDGVLGRDAAAGSDDPLWRTELSWPESLDGGMLDGEFTGSFPTGDGVAGGAFVAEFEILDVTPPWVIRHSPAGNVVGPVDHVVLTFSEPIDASSWGVDDVQLRDGSGTAVAVSSVTQLDPDRFRISFPAQSAEGSYELTVSPEPADLSGNRLDQNRNGVGGEAEDAFEGGFTIVDASEYYFEGFSGELGPEWSFPELDGEGRIRFTTDFAVDPGGRGLMFDSSNASGDNVKSLNEAVLTLDLSTFGDALLTFHRFKLAGSSDRLGEIHVTGPGPDRPDGALGDGVSISNDGNTWYRMRSYTNDEIHRRGDGLWTLEEYDLPAEVARINDALSAELMLDGVVHIKFSQYGGRPFAREGWVIDNVRISGQPDYVHTALERNVIHRLNVPGESSQDLFYRLTLIGEVTPQTPVFVSVHGTDGHSIRSYSHTWFAGALRADAELESLVLVTPAFIPGGRYPAFNFLSWRGEDEPRADMAILSIVEHLESLGLGNSQEIYVYGHSSGGQFTGRFTWAHPHRVAAAFISAPRSHSFPDEHLRYPFGIGPNHSRLASEGVDLSANVGHFLDTRLIFRVGEHDRDVMHPEFQRYPMAVHQGWTRIHRVLNMHEALSDIAQATGRDSALLDHQVLLMEGIGHFTGINPLHTARFYRMMFAPKVDSNVFVHSRFVADPTTEPSRASLPAHVEQWQPGETLYLELWLSTSSAAGIASGTTDLFIDSEVLTPISITHGALFPDNRSGQIDAGTSWIRDVGGATIEAGVGSDAFAMLARIEVLVDGEETLRQLAALPQSGAWMLADGIPGTARTFPLPYAERTVLGGEDLFGQIFDDRNLDGTLDPHEAGLADWTVRLLDEEGADLAVPYRIAAADFGQGAMISKTIPEVTLTAVGGGSLGLSVYARDRNVGGVPTRFFCVQTMTPYAYWWNEQNGFELRADFASPAWQVDVQAHGGWGFSQARMRAYDADGNEIAESFTGNLAGYATETFGVSTASPEIAYVIVTGADSGVRLDELSFVTSVHTQTDAHGHFEFRDVPPGAYQIAVDLPPGWNVIRAINEGNTIHVGDAARRFLAGGAVSDNVAPVIEGLDATPDPIVRPNPLTLITSGVSDPDGHVVRVDFYREGEWLGADTDGSDGWSLNVSTADWDVGEHSLLARAQDDGGAWSEPVTTSVTVQNAAPVIAGVLVQPQPIVRAGPLTLTAVGVSDPDGRVEQVEFYRGDVLLGVVTDGSGGWGLTVGTSDWPLGEQTLGARALDDDGAWGELVSTTATIVNALPEIGSLSGAPDPVTRPRVLTLSAADVSDPDGQVVQVAFYRGDRFLGAADGSDGWSWSGPTADWPPGEQPFSARAQDNDGAWGEMVSTTVTIRNAVPVVASLAAQPDPVTRPDLFTLTAAGVADPDGQVVQVAFYRGDQLLGHVDGSDGWNWTGDTDGWPLGEQTFSARAQDNDGAWGEAASTTATIANAAPVVSGLAVPSDPIRRSAPVSVSALDVSDPDGQVVRVEFYRGDELLGEVDGSEGWTWSGIADGWELGEQTFRARAQDNDGAWSEMVSATATIVNAPPVIDSLFVQPEPVTRGGTLTVSAMGVDDPDGHVVRVEFYRGSEWLGEVDAGDGWTWSGTADSWDLGEQTLSARAEDNDGAWSEMTHRTITVVHANPVVTSFSAMPDPVTRPATLTLAASAISDPDRQVVQVEFYRGNERLGEADGGQNWTWSGSTDGWELGEHTFSARARDNDGAWSEPVSATATIVNAAPVIGSLVVEPDPLPRSGSFTVLAWDVLDPDGQVERVEFYRDDQLLGEVDGSQGWNWTGTADGWAPGEHTFTARAQDNDGAWSEWVSATVTVVNAIPEIASLSASPDPLTRPGQLTLSAAGVTDPDGQVVRVEFYRGEHRLAESDGSSGWIWRGATSDWPVGEQTVSARAQDDEGAWSEWVSTTVTIVNSPPVVTLLTASPYPLPRAAMVTLSALGVNDADGQVVMVEFYRDAELLGESDGSDGWTWTGTTEGWDLGELTFSARARDNDGDWSQWVTRTTTVVNAIPEIGSLSAAPDPVTRPGQLTLSAADVTDADGQVVRVEFYRGNERLGEADADDNWTWSGTTDGWPLGRRTFSARAQDNDGAWSEPVSTTATIVNAAPVIGSLVVEPDPLPRSGSFTVSAWDVLDPDGQVERVEFYRDDQLLGEVDGSQGWNWTGTADGWTPGEHTFTARAGDNDGAWSEWISATVTVVNAIPEIASLSASPDPVTRPGQLTLSAAGVTDPDGHVVRVEFYRGEHRLGESDGSSGWIWRGATRDWPAGEQTVSARARDDEGAWSEWISTTVTIRNAAPVITLLTAAPYPLPRSSTLTLTAQGVSDPDGHVVRVAFYRGELLLGESDGSDGWRWTGDTTGWPLGEQTFYARAEDNEGNWSETVARTTVVVNAVPDVGSLSAAPDPITRPGVLTLTAGEVFDPDGQVERVAFYRGQELLGESDGSEGWTWSGPTDGWPLGRRTFFARAQDDEGAWGEKVSTTVTIANAAPVIAELSATPDPVPRPNTLTLVATGVVDPDGLVTRVEFYRGQELLGESDGSDGWTWTGDTTAWEPGQVTLQARAQDDDGAWSEWAIATVTVENALPAIEALVADPDTITSGDELTLTATGVDDPDGTVERLEFWLGEVGGDGTLLGEGDHDNGDWTLLVSGDDTIAWPLGEHILLARARDDDGAWSEWVSTTVQLDNAPPVVASLAVTPDLVTTPDLLNLTAQGVSDPGGFVVQVAFFRGEELLGVVEEGNDAWTLSVETAGWPSGEHEFTARAQDNEGAWSGWVTATATVASWTNPENPLDVNADGAVSPLDVLAIINRINLQGDGPLPPRTWDNLDEPYYDVTEDRHVIARDVLQVINYLNYAQTGDPEESGQGEALDGGIAAEPWLPLAPQTLGRPAPWLASDSEIATDLRVDLLTAASEESAELLGRDHQQPAARRPGTQPIDRFHRNRTQPDSEWEEDLPDWESLLETQSTDRASLDAFFATLA